MKVSLARSRAVIAAVLVSSLATPVVSQIQGTPQGSPPASGGCDMACVRANMGKALVACAPRIEAEAPGDYEWLYRPYGGIFQEGDPPSEPRSSVARYRGDAIRFLSPQKEWVRAVYECGFDVSSERVAYVRAELGVMGKPRAVPVLPGAQPSVAAAPNTGAGATAKPVPQPVANVGRISEPSEVDVRQVSPRAKPRP
jgi:hypothetical protein